MREKKVLIIAYYFPPLGMGGVQRATKFAKYLPQFGWKPYLLTVKDVEYRAKDPSLLDEIPPQVEISRTGSLDPLRVLFMLKNVLGRKYDAKPPSESPGGWSWLSWLFFPDNKVGWIPFALRKGLSLCRREKIDLIFSSSPPPSAHLAASIIKRTTGIPWVADFRDPWIGYKLERTPTPLHRFFRRKLKKAIITGADRVVAANPVIQEELTNEHGKLSKFHLLDQGYDEEDFQDYRWNKPEKFTLGYLGTFSPDCNPEPIFRALGELIRLNLVPKEEVRLLHVGGCVQVNLEKLIQKHGLQEVVRTTGYLSHKEALSRMQDASVLLLITCDDPRVFPAKIFEYLRLGIPILGLVPPKSRMAEFLREMQAEAVMAPEDVEGIKQAILTCFAAFKSGKLNVAYQQDSLIGFERKILTGQLASLFDEVVSE